MNGLVWNSMMSMAGGWFFLTIVEAFTLDGRTYRLPGLGSYMASAVEAGDGRAMAWAVVAMITMIVAVDQLIWRPDHRLGRAVPERRHRVGAASARSWFFDLLRNSPLTRWLRARATKAAQAAVGPCRSARRAGAPAPRGAARGRPDRRSAPPRRGAVSGSRSLCVARRREARRVCSRR